VSGHTEVRTQEIPVPEPDLTPEAVIERARALIPAVRAQQDEAERLGHHTAELDRQFTEAGFYRILHRASSAATRSACHVLAGDAGRLRGRSRAPAGR
jgi:hypothetical protein